MTATIIAVVNQKGGVAKSTTAQNVGHCLMAKGNDVLYIDLDAQGNLSYTLKANTDGYNVLGALERPETAVKEIQKTDLADILPSTPALSGADSILTAVGKEYKLKECIAQIERSCNYDYIIIDTPPALSILTINALTASQFVVIPAQADIYSLQGITQLKSTIDVVKKYTNPNLKVLGIALTRYNARATLTKELTSMVKETAKELNTVVFKTVIRENVAIKESQAVRQNLLKYAPKSNGAIDYKELTDEIIESALFA